MKNDNHEENQSGLICKYHHEVNELWKSFKKVVQPSAFGEYVEKVRSTREKSQNRRKDLRAAGSSGVLLANLELYQLDLLQFYGEHKRAIYAGSIEHNYSKMLQHYQEMERTLDCRSFCPYGHLRSLRAASKTNNDLKKFFEHYVENLKIERKKELYACVYGNYLSFYHVRQMDLKRAFSYGKKAVELYRKLGFGKTQQFSDLAHTVFEFSAVCVRLRRLEDAWESLLLGVRVLSLFHPFTPFHTKFFLEFVVFFDELGEYKKSKLVLRALQKAVPEHSIQKCSKCEIMYNLAGSYLKLRKYKKAEKYLNLTLDSICDKPPEYILRVAIILRMLGDIYFHRNGCEKARKTWTLARRTVMQLQLKGNSSFSQFLKKKSRGVLGTIDSRLSGKKFRADLRGKEKVSVEKSFLKRVDISRCSKELCVSEKDLRGTKYIQRMIKAFSPSTKFCLFCDILLKDPKRCSVCTIAHYCSSDHQKLDWKRHKMDCKIIKKLKEKKFF